MSNRQKKQNPAGRPGDAEKLRRESNNAFVPHLALRVKALSLAFSKRVRKFYLRLLEMNNAQTVRRDLNRIASLHLDRITILLESDESDGGAV